MQMRVIQLLEKGFERLGRFIARKPFLVILCCLVFTGICAIGFLNLRLNSDIFAVWDTNPSRRSDGSQAVVNRDWISDRFEDDKRDGIGMFMVCCTSIRNILCSNWISSLPKYLYFNYTPTFCQYKLHEKHISEIMQSWISNKYFILALM